MRQEIIAYEETQEHEVIYYSLKVKLEGQLHLFKLKIQVLTDDTDLNELELH
jgi:hypothetical protein